MTPATDRLRQFALIADPGPWNEGTVFLTNIAPSLALLCADMADALESIRDSADLLDADDAHLWHSLEVVPALLARFDSLAAAGPV